MGKKRIFISDIHMGDARSQDGSGGLHRYGWFNKEREALLAEFLEMVSEDASIDELIVIGDIFDDWVCPSNFTQPPAVERFKKIADYNDKAITAFKKIATGNKKLIYLPGNHDMLLTKDILEGIIPGVVYKGTSPGLGAYEDPIGYLIAEHGNKYGLFNAPDPFSNGTAHSLPLGYFMTRALAYKMSQTGEDTDYVSALADGIKDLMEGEKRAKAVYEALAEAAGLTGASPIEMNGVDNYANTIKSSKVAEIFKDIYKKWADYRPDIGITRDYAQYADFIQLFKTAEAVHFKLDGPVKIAIFGHSHEVSLRRYNASYEEYEKPQAGGVDFTTPAFIYANSGTWVNGKPTTYIETKEINGDIPMHRVRIMRYKAGGEEILLDEDKVHI